MFDEFKAHSLQYTQWAANVSHSYRKKIRIVLDLDAASGSSLVLERPMSTLRIKEFAKLAGVTVRALHHYDRLGLLSAAHRSEGGYRLYCHDDLGRLERILVLRFLGLSLQEIGELLRAPGSPGAHSLRDTLIRQQAVLRDRREELDRIIRAIGRAQASALNLAEPEWFLYQTILKEIHMQGAQNWTEKYYSAEGVEALRAARLTWTPEAGAELRAKWQALYAEIQHALDCGTPPDSAEGRALVGRWMRLSDEFTLGNPELSKGFERLYADERNWPDDEMAHKMRENRASAAQRDFFHAALHACLRHG
jgi:DNA-binding transcriptional MerR regulator